ncbi:MAG: hypothetical protein ACR2PI_20640 [Hyphomicrobiaceae bacterium]
MSKYYSSLALGVLACGLLGGCATITQGTTQLVQVNSAPQGANCRLTRKGQLLTSVRTPQSVTVPRSVHDVNVSCLLPDGRKGHAMLKTTLTPMVAGNILVGGVIGAGVDAASGAMNEYPDSITVRVRDRSAPNKIQPLKKPAPDPYGARKKPVS